MKRMYAKNTRNDVGKIVAIVFGIGIMVGSMFVFTARVRTDVSRPPTDIAVISSDYPNYNYDELYRHVFLSTPDYGYTRSGSNFSSFFKYDLSEQNGAQFDNVGPFKLDLSYWVIHENESQVFHFNITIYEVESTWEGLDVDYNTRPERIGQIGKMELTGLGNRIEDPVLVNLNIDFSQSVAIEIVADLENATVGFGYEDPNYDSWYYEEYDYYDDYIGVYFDEPHFYSENTDVPMPSLWLTVIGCGMLFGGFFMMISPFLLHERRQNRIMENQYRQQTDYQPTIEDQCNMMEESLRYNPNNEELHQEYTRLCKRR